VLADHREQVAEQLALLGSELLGDVVDRRRVRSRVLLGTDPGVPAPVETALGRLGLL
jgi:hypothetical protein